MSGEGPMLDIYAFKVILGGFFYIVTPGPVFLSIVTIVSEKNRLQALKLVSGAILGCMVWLSFTAFSFIEAHRLPDYVFLAMTFACALYLFWLGLRMFQKARTQTQEQVFKKPFWDGLIISLFNPKSYPVMLSVFTVLIIEKVQNMTWQDFPEFFAFAITGFAAGYMFMVVCSGFNIFTSFYRKNLATVSYIFSFIYFGFGLHLLINLSV